MEEDNNHTHYYVTQLNYAVQEKELDMQHEQINADCTNADLIHHCELNHKQKDIELKQAEEHIVV